MENLEKETQQPAEKTFTQAEVDEIVAKRLGRGKAKGEQPVEEERPMPTEDGEQPVKEGENSTKEGEKMPEEAIDEPDGAEKKPENPEEAQAQETGAQPQQQDELLQRMGKAELKAAMAVQGVDPQKLDRAVRLIGTEEFMVNGQIDETRMIELITELLGTWPELAKQNGEQKIKFGLGQTNTNQNNSQISEIFGNK